LEEPVAFIFRVKVMVYGGDRPEDVGKFLYVVAAAKLWVVVVIIICCTALDK
jgi:hypothetical protein